MPQHPDKQIELVVEAESLDEEIDRLLAQGYRIDMIMPSDSPSEALLSRAGEALKLRLVDAKTTTNNVDWTFGRAGMEYRDLIEGRVGGHLIASHIKLPKGGDVADYAHYHNIAFQMIYCWQGRVHVVYENQGDSFWLEPGDCVLQPPGIRHRVLASDSGTHVIELTSPAIHETWADHEIQLPTALIHPERNFSGQRFVLHRSENETSFRFSDGFEEIDLEMETGSGGAIRAFELRTNEAPGVRQMVDKMSGAAFYFVLSGRLEISRDGKANQNMSPGDAIIIPTSTGHTVTSPSDSAILCVVIPA